MNDGIKALSKAIYKISTKKINIMEFCGTHTHEIFRYGIRQLLPQNIRLLSGPGCPVCVTSEEDIDTMIAIAQQYKVGIITFGDMVNVPGSKGSLNHLRAMGGEVHVVYSPLESLNIAKNNPTKDYILIGIGFETTAPTLAFTLKRTKDDNIKNLYFFALNKLTPPAMKALLDMGEIKINGIIGPGHVSTIIGKKGWNSVFEKYNIPFVIMGFEPLDILEGLYIIITQIEEGKPALVNAYPRSVSDSGNLKAQALIRHVFKQDNATWRGMGILPNSGLVLNENYIEFDAVVKFPVEIPPPLKTACRCGEVLRGVITPFECPLFGKICTPDNPKGPCMVSQEGACSAYYLYGGEV